MDQFDDFNNGKRDRILMDDYVTKSELKQVEQHLDSRIDKLSAKIDGHTNNFQIIDKQLVKIDKRSDEIEKHFELVDNRFMEVDNRFEQVDKRFQEVDKRFVEVNNRFNGVDNQIVKLEAEIEKNGVSMDSLKNEIINDRKINHQFFIWIGSLLTALTAAGIAKLFI